MNAPARGISSSTPTERQTRKIFGISIWYVVTILVCVVMVLPLTWMLGVALKGSNDIYKIPPEFFPSEFHWENFLKGPQAINFFQLFLNTTAITVLSTIGSMVSSTLVGYGLSRIRFPGRKIWFYLFVSSMMLPGIVSLIPMFHLYLSLGFYDTWIPLILPGWLGNPFFIFLARQFYLSIPLSLDEAAKIDGAGHFTIFTRIMLPLTSPVWITMAIMSFTATWNDYLTPLVYLYTDSKWTLSLGMASFAGAFAGVATTQWNQYMATNLLYMLPPLIIFFVAQRYFMQGVGSLTSTARTGK